MVRGKENMKKWVLLSFAAFVLCLFRITPALAAEGKMNVAVISADLADKDGKMYLGSETFSTIKVENTKISLSKTSLTLNKGESAKITAKVTGTKKKATWSSSDSSVATVSKGKITAKKAGTAIITAKVNGKKAKCKVTVEAGQDYVKKGCYYKKYELSPRFAGNIPGEDSLTIIEKSSTHIRFMLEHYGVNGSPWYHTNLIRVKVSKNKTSVFRWRDVWGNRGTGYITFKNGKAVIRMNYKKEALGNRWSWPKTNTLSFKTSKISENERKRILAVDF